MWRSMPLPGLRPQENWSRENFSDTLKIRPSGCIIIFIGVSEPKQEGIIVSTERGKTTMRKRILAFTLSMAMLLGLAWQPAYADAADTDTSQPTTAEHWFYNQLSVEAAKIYVLLENAYQTRVLEDGQTPIELNMDDAAAAYLQGNRSLFNDFSAAKDAFDLEHPEAWYFDSAQLSLTATGTATSATASMGTGKSDSYFVLGANDGEGLTVRDKALTDTVADIVEAAQAVEETDGTYKAIKYVHDEVINRISYTYEIDCQPGNAGFVRTAYALVTGEGVCEGYVRSFQMILNEMGIPCVPIHGTQTSGTPEQHMWCAVYIDDDKGTGWYVVDPTWDDPIVDPIVLPADSVEPDGESHPGVDGGECDTYFMVGNDVIGANWIPSGYVSTGTKEFRYPSIAPRSYGSGQFESNGLVVTYDDKVMEGTLSTVYHISYQGKGLYEAQREGYYILIKMYDINADGSEDKFEDWYYSVHGLLLTGESADNFKPEGPYYDIGNRPYYYDTEEYLVQIVSNCEFVEFAVTRHKPPEWKDTMDLFPADRDPNNPNAPIGMGGYLKDSDGTEDDIIAKTGLIYNPNGNYEQPPYAKNVSPDQRLPTYVGATYTIHMEFTDPLYHPDQDAIDKAAAIGKVNEAGEIVDKKESVGLDYTGQNHSWGMNGGLPHTFAQRPDPQNVRWDCETHGIHKSMSDIGSACRLTTLEFEFKPSVMWADDSVAYQFFVTGLVGIKSNKKPAREGMSFVFENASCATRYRCPCLGGIDWNLWGQPQLLDDPNNLIDQLQVNSSGNPEDKDDLKSLKDLFYESVDGQINKDSYDMNGRLLLVVEDAGANREKANAMSEQLEKKGVDLQEAVASALYEIDFARICGQTVVETGQSLRMQVGFPAGFDASELSNTVFKVYHFIKEDGEITGVEEIPVTVTPYGLVFVVRSFSPFAIVAEEVEESDVDDSRSVVLVSGSHGKITSNYKLGENEVVGSLKLTSDDSYTITITPDEGYTLESITATGLVNGIKYEEENTDDNGTSYKITLSYDDIGASNAMIGVTFVEIGDEIGDETEPAVEVLSLCGHASVKSEGGTSATCTEDGETPTVICKDCKQVISGGEVIHATGHVYKQPDDDEYQEPTCTEPGTELTCTVTGCGATSQAPALGHKYDKGVCVHEGCDEVEQCTVTFNPNGGQIKSGQSTVTVGANNTLDEAADAWPKVERSGYDFSGWYMVPSPGERDKAVSSLNVTRSIMLYATWNWNGSDEADVWEISVTADPSDGGTVSGDGSYKTGETVTLTASPNNGYSFLHWSEDGIVVESSSTYSFTAEADRTLVAVFTKDNSSETPGSGSDGSDTPGSGTGGSDTPGSGTGGSDTPGSGTGGSNTPGSGTGGSGTPGSGTGGSGTTPGSGTGGSNTPGSGTGGSGTTPGSGTGGSNTPGSGTGDSGTTTKTETAPDGTVTTTVTDSKTGASTVTVKSPDGSVSVTETDAAGNISRQESFADGVKVSTKIPVNGSVSASVSLPAGMESATVTVQAPVTAGTVAVNSATGKVVMRSVPVDGGLKVVLDGSADIVLVDRSMDFGDMPGSHWAADSVDFVTAHGLFNGTGDKFSPDTHMTRTMLMTVLARFDGVDTDSGSTWYEAGMEWAVANKISDGTNPDADISREELAVMLYRYAGLPELNDAGEVLSGYPDAGEIDDWASLAMRWAVQNGIIQGTYGRLNPGGKALRSEVSAMIERFCRNIATG